jgi:hypothetical protein
MRATDQSQTLEACHEISLSWSNTPLFSFTISARSRL